MAPEFQIAVLATYTTDDEILRICDRIPHSEDFVRLWVLPSVDPPPRKEDPWSKT